MSGNLIPIILHFSAVLGPSWQIVLFTMEPTWKMPASVPFRRAVEEKRIRVQFLPPETNMADWWNVSLFLLKPWLWEQLKSASRVLLFQTDSIICSNSAHKIEDFMEWDFIGAPYARYIGPGYNGGLSLRNPNLILEILKAR